MAHSINKGWVGAGIAYRHRYRAGLLAFAQNDPHRPRALEVMAEHFYTNPDALCALGEAFPLVFHDVGLSAGTVDRDDRGDLGRIKALCDLTKPLMFTEHASLSCSPEGLSLGHLAPLWFTDEALCLLVDKVRRWQDALGVPIALETITAPFTIPCADMDEPTFLQRLTERAGCGLLLDLTNLWINGQNHGFDPLVRLRDYPLGAVWSVHLSGGHFVAPHWIDTHDSPTSDASFDMLRALRTLGASHLQTITIERDGHWPDLSALCAEALRAHQIWTDPSP
jgi:uncharacterized protein (UPF0276 family)